MCQEEDVRRNGLGMMFLTAGSGRDRFVSWGLGSMRVDRLSPRPAASRLQDSTGAVTSLVSVRLQNSAEHIKQPSGSSSPIVRRTTRAAPGHPTT